MCLEMNCHPAPPRPPVPPTPAVFAALVEALAGQPEPDAALLAQWWDEMYVARVRPTATVVPGRGPPGPATPSPPPILLNGQPSHGWVGRQCRIPATTKEEPQAGTCLSHAYRPTDTANAIEPPGRSGPPGGLP